MFKQAFERDFDFWRNVENYIDECSWSEEGLLFFPCICPTLQAGQAHREAAKTKLWWTVKQNVMGLQTSG